MALKRLVGKKPDEKESAVATGQIDEKRRIGRGAFLKGSGALVGLAILGGTGAWQAVGPGSRPAAARAGTPLPEAPLLAVGRAGASPRRSWRRLLPPRA